MQSPLVVLAVACALLWAACAPTADGQRRCSRWNGRPSLCAQFPEIAAAEWFFHEESLQPSMLYASRFAEVYLNSLLLSPWSDDCLLTRIKGMCTTWLRPCVMADDGEGGLEPLPFPERACNGLCQSYLTNCSDFIDAALLGLGLNFGLNNFYDGSAPPIECTEQEAVDNFNASIPVFPESTELVDVALLDENGAPTGVIRHNVTAVCHDLSDYRSLDQVKIVCDDPLAYSDDEGICMFRCPLETFSDSEYDAIKITQTVLAAVSLAACSFLVLSFLVHPEKRAFPTNMIAMMGLAIAVCCVGFLLAPVLGHDNVWCDGGDELLAPDMSVVANAQLSASQLARVETDMDDLIAHGSLCTLQGFFIVFGFEAAYAWYTAIAFSSFLNVCFATKAFCGAPLSPAESQLSDIAGGKRKRRVKRALLIAAYHVFGWGLPFLLALVPAAAGRMAFQPGGTFCFVSPEDDNAWQIVFWFVPVGTMMALGTTFLLAMLAKILVVDFVRKRGLWRADVRSATLLKAVAKLNVRVLLFVFVFLVDCILVFLWHVVVETREEDIQDAYDRYYKCLLFGTYPDDDDNTFRFECDQDEDLLDYGLVVAKSVGYTAMGLILSLLFLSTPAIYKHWLRLAKLCCRGKFKEALYSVSSSGSGHKKRKKKKGSLTTISDATASTVASGEEMEDVYPTGGENQEDDEEDETEETSLDETSSPSDGSDDSGHKVASRSDDGERDERDRSDLSSSSSSLGRSATSSPSTAHKEDGVD